MIVGAVEGNASNPKPLNVDEQGRMKIGTTTEARIIASLSDNAPGDAVDVRGYRKFTVSVKAEEVTTGATVAIQARVNDDWLDLDTQMVAANGSTLVQFEGPFTELRANVTNRTDGTYTVTLFCQ
jgi:hypothetical protein